MYRTFVLPTLAAALLLVGAAVPALAPQAGAEPAAAKAATIKKLYAFPGERGGYFPRGGLAADAKGNLYGTTLYDGDCDWCGIAYMLSPPKPGQKKWGYRVLRRFQGGGSDGNSPTGALTVAGSSVYGTLSAGANSSCGCGAVFELRPLNAAKTRWKYTLIYRFNDRNSGATPTAGVVMGKDDALYGTTSSGGANGNGTLFKLKKTGGKWSRTVLHHFRPPLPDPGRRAS